MIKNYFKTAWRSLWKYRTVSFLNIGGLAVGMAAAVFIFLWVQNELHFDDYHPDKENIYRIKCHISIDKSTTWLWETSPYRMGQEAEHQVPGVERIARIRPLNGDQVYFKIKDEFFKEDNAALVDSNWFDVFKYQFISGGPTSFNKEPFSLILSESKAKKYFGNTNAVGQVIHIDSLDYKIQGVIKDNPANSSFNFDVLMPVASRQANPRERKNDLGWANFNYLTFLKLNPQANTRQVAARINQIANKARETDNLKVSLISLADMHFESDLQSSSLVHGNSKMITVFAVLGVFLLLIACINYVNITTARASLRAKEVSVKKIVGAGRGALFWQFVAESALISSLALVLTLIILTLSMGWFNQFTGKNFTLDVTDSYVLLVIGGTLLVSVVLNSIYPALLLSSFKPLNTFRGISILKVSDASLRKALVVIQFGFSIFLIIGVITIYRQMEFIQKQNPGYDRAQVVSFRLPFKLLFRKMSLEQRQSMVQTVKHELQQSSALAEVSVVDMESIQNFRSQSSGDLDWEGRAKDFDPAATFFNVEPDYTRIVKLNFLKGRWFDRANEADKKNVILNEAAVREFGLREPVIGQRFSARGDTGQVIGVVKDFNYRSVHDKISPAIFKWATDYSLGYLVKVQPGKQREAIDYIQALWNKYYEGEPFVYSFLDQEFNNIYETDNKVSALITVFATLAIIISCLGLFGLAAFTAEQRGKEISIRKILGATVSSIVTMLSSEFILLVFIALLIAGPLAWWLMNKWLQDFAYRINMQWWMPVIAGIVAAIIAFCTIGVQAMKAAIEKPVKRLRSE